MKPNCRVVIKIMYFYVVLSIFETLNPNMSPKLGFESPLPCKQSFSAKEGHVFVQKIQASIIVLQTSFLV